MFKRGLMAASAAVLALAAGAAQAQSAFQPKAAGTWMINVRATDVAPDNSHPILTAAGAATGLNAHVDSDVMPTLGFTYFFTDNIAVEVIAGTTRHTIKAVGPGTDVVVREQWVLPPVVSLQYHPLPAARFSPYVGGGVNYMFYYAGSNRNGFTTDLKNGVGWSVQGGVDYAINGPWSLNVDVKKVFHKTNAVINGGALTSHVGLDPWVISAGFGRKF